MQHGIIFPLTLYELLQFQKKFLKLMVYQYLSYKLIKHDGTCIINYFLSFFYVKELFDYIVKTVWCWNNFHSEIVSKFHKQILAIKMAMEVN